MMSILIRGMEMPKERSLWLCIKTDGTVYNIKPGGVGTAHAVGTAVPLPEKHGRLIDAEAFEDAFIRYYLSQERNNHLVFTPVEIKQHLADMIGDWPTIVPAEGGNGRCSEN